jgi:hypothetical protein
MVLQTQLQRNYFTYSDWKIVGIIDSDGSFAFRLTKRKDNKVGFNLLNVITQTERNKELLVHLRDQLGVTAQLRTTITGKLASGADKKCCVLDIAWTTKGGQKLLQIFKKCPPRCPGKYRNYLIGQILLESLQNKYILKKIDSQSWRPALKERISSAVAVLLSFQTSNEINPYSKTRKKESTPEEW